VDVTFWDAVRFANYLDDGNTETGAYTLDGGTPTPSNASMVTRNAGATVWLPSENEWYKAAYYDPANGTYSTYATRSDSAPGNAINSGFDQANFYTSVYSVTQDSGYDSSENYLTAVGTFSGSPSYYGTFDQSGDVFNWNDTSISDYRGDRGGGWDDVSSDLESSDRGSLEPTAQSIELGFRVASESSIPEPALNMLILTGLVGSALMRGKTSKLNHGFRGWVRMQKRLF